MVSVVENIRSLSGAGVLADRSTRSPKLEFRRFNLIYGFNGSGKSTLSRMFASLQSGVQHDRLPASCKFEFELDDGAILGSPSRLGGLERRVLVFNADFVEQNLQWATGLANPVFYIGREQAALAAKLANMEARVPAATQRLSNATELLKANEKALATFKRERARVITDRLRLKGRKYEAPQLTDDFSKLDLGGTAKLSEDALEAVSTTCRLNEAMSRITELTHHDRPLANAIQQARTLAGQTLGAFAIEELERHPEMLLWVKKGHEYHKLHSLNACLHCGSHLTLERRELLERVLDDRLSHFLGLVDAAHADAVSAGTALDNLAGALPSVEMVSSDIRAAYKEASFKLSGEIKGIRATIHRAASILTDKRGKPTLTVDVSDLSSDFEVAAAVASLVSTLGELNGLIRAHNERVEGFGQHQEDARIAVRRHFLAEANDEYAGLNEDQRAAVGEEKAADDELRELTKSVAQLRAAIREHGPAADQMNKLIDSYLGHGELSISAIAEGYEIHRHGRLVEGAPSEGEKTAIAICYFISTLESDGRLLKDLIVVVDDPISSLDTKALNFACALVKSRLSNIAQLFVLTHNQHCMNEFKKSWKNKARPKDPTKTTARFLFMDVRKEGKARKSTLVEMSKLLREYDFEYHFLIDHVLKFDASSDNEYVYGYMMPNILRRVLDVFLAFRCPGSSGLSEKINQLCSTYGNLDRDRMTALDRLTQVESHSDSLDDLIAFSSMTLEESRDATAALIAMMQVVDPDHLAGLRKICV